MIDVLFAALGAGMAGFGLGVAVGRGDGGAEAGTLIFAPPGILTLPDSLRPAPSGGEPAGGEAGEGGEVHAPVSPTPAAHAPGNVCRFSPPEADHG